MVNKNSRQATTLSCVGCGTSDEVINGLCSQCSGWLKIRSCTHAIKALLKKIGGHHEVKKR